MCVCVYKTTKIVCLLQKLRGKKQRLSFVETE